MTNYGWLDLPEEVEKITATLPSRFYNEQPVQASGDILPYLLVRKLIGKDVPIGPQQIGDCVSWGWGNGVNYTALMQIAKQLGVLDTIGLINNGQWVREAQDHPNFAKSQAVLEEYQETCTEWIYGSSRVEIGNQRGSMQDGSVGAWAMKSTTKLGTASRKKYGAYDPQRAKKWGAEGVPDDYEPTAKVNVFTECLPVTSYDEAVKVLRSYRFIPVCSDQGFEETRRPDGSCRPMGQWMHCMLFCALRDKDGFVLTSQSWGDRSPTGPRDLDQPVNTFWTDPDTVDRMLRQRDSFAPSGYVGYEATDLITWRH